MKKLIILIFTLTSIVANSQLGYKQNYTITQLRSISAPAVVGVTFKVTDSGQEGEFYYDATDNSSLDNTGTIIVSATGKRFKRVYSGAVNVKWFGAKGNYNYQTSSGTDDYTALQAAINAANEKATSVYFPNTGTGLLYGCSQPLQIGQVTRLFGDHSSFPMQADFVSNDTQYYKVQSGIYFYNATDGIVMQTAENYRDQFPTIENLAIIGSGKANNTTGVKFNSNPTYTTSPDVGMALLNHLYIDGFKTGVDGQRADTWWVYSSHISACQVGIRGGKQDGRFDRNVFFSTDTALIIHGAFNNVTNNEIEPNGVGVVLDSAWYSNVTNNNFKDITTAVLIKNTSQSNLVAHNNISGATTVGVKIDSAGKYNDISRNTIYSTIGTSVWVRQTEKVNIRDNSFNNPVGSNYAIKLDTCTTAILHNNFDGEFDQTHKLSVTNSTNLDLNYFTGQRQHLTGTFNNQSGYYAFRASGGTFQSPTALASGATIGIVKGEGYNGTSYPQTVNIGFYANEAQTTSAQGSRIDFEVTPNASTTRARRGYVDGNGITAIGSSGGTATLGGSGTNVGFVNVQNGGVGQLRVNGTSKISWDGNGASFSGAIVFPIASKTSAYTLSTSEYTVTGNATGGAFSLTLPSATGCTGRIYVLKKTDASANAVTVATSSSQTIDGATSYSLNSQNKYVTVQSDGTNWIIIANN